MTNTYTEEQIMEDLEKVKIESEDIMKEFNHVIKRQNTNDYIIRAAIIHSLSVVMAEYFCHTSENGHMDADAAKEYWGIIVYNMLVMVNKYYVDKAN